jgi:uncharacterized protein DUF222
MCSSDVDPAVEQVAAGLDALADTDVVALDDPTLRRQLLALSTAANRVNAELIRRVDVFDRRALAEQDGFRTAKSWLQGFGRMSGQVAHRFVKAARLLRRLPKLAAVVQSGEVSAEHVQQVARLAEQVTVEQVAEVEATLADAARVLDLPRFAMVCERVRAHVDPDGQDPGEAFERRSLTLSPSGGMVIVRGQLDPEGGAALATALDAVMAPPAEGDERSSAQRRADALAELARRPLAAGELPTVGGQRPQVGVLLYPQALSPKALATLARLHHEDAAGRRFQRLLTDPEPVDWTRPGVRVEHNDNPTRLSGRASEVMLRNVLSPPPTRSGHEPVSGSMAGSPRQALVPAVEAGVHVTADRQRTSTEDAATAPRTAAPPGPQPAVRAPAWSRPGWADPPWLEWVGPIPPAVAQRIACDADIWRVILDPDTGMPLDVGRAHRLVPYWIRRALHARDRGCRWPGCTTPAPWTDAHHLQPWAENGQTRVEDCLLLCRYHHGLVHEGGWRIHLDRATGEVRITRPEGTSYRLPQTRSTPWNGPTTQAG